jgi:hypothetical protein
MTPPLSNQVPALRKSPQLGTGNLHPVVKYSHDPTIEEWNLQIQRSLPGDMLLTVGYVGTHGTDLMGPFFKQYNYIHTQDRIKYKIGINNIVPTSSIYSSSTTLNALDQVYGSTNLPLSLLLQPYPFFPAQAGGINSTSAYNATSIYDALDVELVKRFGHGLTFNIVYTWSKEIDNGGVGNLAATTVDTVHFFKSGNIGGRAANFASQFLGAPYQDPDNVNGDR